MERPEIVAAVPTPFRGDGSLDLDTAEVLFARLAPRVDGIFLCGTNGEFAALDDDERIELAERALRHVPADRLVVHVGAASTWQSVRLMRRMAALPLRRFAAITPMVHRVGSRAVVDHYERLRAAMGDGALYAYVFEEIAGNVLDPEDYRRLEGTVDGVKASGHLATRIGRFTAVRPDAPAWTGDDGGLPSALDQGAVGTVSGCASVFPGAWRDLAIALQTGVEVAAAQRRVARIADTVGRSIAHVRCALAFTGLDLGPTRMTFDAVSPADRDRIRLLVDEEVRSSIPV